MAIYPYFSTTIINKDVLINSSFKAGMALVLDNNGRAIKADSQLLIFDSAAQKYGKFLGFATSDHDISGNTIIIPDVIGSNYLDSNLNFVKTENTEYSIPKRALLDYQDSAISSFYNNTDLNPAAKRGVGVYNTPGDYFVTDQFVRVLHGDYGLDLTTTVELNPGDLLTFGGGINAGKLVKVNIDSFGPEVLIIGTVLKHVPSSGLLYFKQSSYRSLFGANPYVLSLDAGNPASYTADSTTALNLANSSNIATLLNGTGYSSISGGTWVFDGTNDYISTSVSNITLNNASFTALCWVNLTLPTKGTFFHIGDGNNGIAFGVGYQNLEQVGNSVIVLYPIVRWVNNSYNMGTYNLGWNFVAITSDNSKNTTTYLNNNSGVNVGVNDANLPGSNTITLGRCNESPSTRYLNGKLSHFNLYNRALSATEISNYYNATKGRYGL